MKHSDYSPERPRVRLFGRDRELAACLDAITGYGGGAVLIGPPGLGGSALGRTVYDRIADPKHWVTADPILGQVAFGALAPLLSHHQSSDATGLDHEVLRALRGTSGVSPVIFVDDAHYLDEESIAVLIQLAAAQEIRLVIITRPDSRVLADVAELILDRVLIRVNLTPIDAQACGHLIETTLGGLVTSRLKELFTLVSGGNPAVLKASLQQARTTRAILNVEGVWLLNGQNLSFDGSPTDMMLLWLASLDQVDRQALEFVAMTGPISLDQLIDAGHGEATDRLLTARVFTMGAGPQFDVSLAASLPSGLMRGSVSAIRAEAMYLQHHGQAPSPGAITVDQIRWAIDAHVPIPADEVRAAAQQALADNEPTFALQLLNFLPETELTPAAMIDLARARAGCGHSLIAYDLLLVCVEDATCVADATLILLLLLELKLRRGDSFTKLKRRLARWRDDIAKNVSNDSHAVLAKVTTIIDAGIDACLGQLRVDSADIEKLAQDHDEVAIVRVLALEYLAAQSSLAGRSSHAAMLSAQAAEIPGVQPAAESFAVLLGTLHPLLPRARSRDRFQPTTDAAHMAATSGRLDFEAGLAALRAGDSKAALVHIRKSIAALRYWDNEQLLPLACAIAAVAAASVQDVVKLQEAAEDFDLLSVQGSYTSWLLAQGMRVTAEYVHLEDPAQLSELQHLIAQAAEVSVAIEGWLRTCALLVGDLEAVKQMADIGPDVDDECVVLIAALGQRLRAGEATALLELRDFFSTRFPRAARACEAELRTLAAAESGIELLTILRKSPAHNGDIRYSLSARERQVGELILGGLSNKEMAQQLGVSTRTVEGHNSSLFRKVGITRRSQLRAEDIAD